MAESVITDLSDMLGFTVEAIIKFFANFLGGWMLFLDVMTVGIIVIIYFRFYRQLVSGRDVTRGETR